MVIKYEKDENGCRRCRGLGTIPTPDGKHNETCPICGGSGKKREKKRVDWLRESRY